MIFAAITYVLNIESNQPLTYLDYAFNLLAGIVFTRWSGSADLPNLHATTVDQQIANLYQDFKEYCFGVSVASAPNQLPPLTNDESNSIWKTWLVNEGFFPESERQPGQPVFPALIEPGDLTQVPRRLAPPSTWLPVLQAADWATEINKGHS